ncbi:hypothetical protein PAXRUDRAFT_170652, partial [Paxillus rubicundulus Ve08.2h10]
DFDTLCTVDTRMGKMQGFGMPLLFQPDGVQIVVMPLNLLGKKSVASLGKAGI